MKIVSRPLKLLFKQQAFFFSPKNLELPNRSNQQRRNHELTSYFFFFFLISRRQEAKKKKTVLTNKLPAPFPASTPPRATLSLQTDPFPLQY
jgi:hypothetical protein